MNNDLIDLMIDYLDKTGNIEIGNDGKIYLGIYGGFKDTSGCIKREEIEPLYRMVIKDSLWGSVVYFAVKTNQKPEQRVCDFLAKQEIWRGYGFI